MIGLKPRFELAACRRHSLLPPGHWLSWRMVAGDPFFFPAVDSTVKPGSRIWLKADEFWKLPALPADS